MSRGLNSVLAGLIVFVSLFSFQNCGSVNLEKAPTVLPDIYLKAEGNICLSAQYSNYTLKSVMATNLNLLIKNGEPYVDSDVDGISDVDEQTYGLNPLNRRTDNKVLDKVCFDLAGGESCAALVPNCSNQAIGLGISDCDAEALNLDALNQVDHGIDADQDGVIDLLEVIRGTVASRNDSLEDPDHDFVLNYEEINVGTNPLYHDRDTNSQYKVALEASKNNTPEIPCSGESWDVKIDRVPILRIPAFDGSGDPSGAKLIDFSRAKDENLILLVMVLKPKSGTQNLIYMYKTAILTELTEYMPLSIDEFQKAGEVAQ